MTDVKDSKLMRWYDKHDIICSRLRIRTPESGLRGVFAAEDIPPCEGIAVIPPHMLIRSPFKDMEEIVQVNTTELVAYIIVVIFRACRNVDSILIDRPRRG